MCCAFGSDQVTGNPSLLRVLLRLGTCAGLLGLGENAPENGPENASPRSIPQSIPSQEDAGSTSGFLFPTWVKQEHLRVDEIRVE